MVLLYRGGAAREVVIEARRPHRPWGEVGRHWRQERGIAPADEDLFLPAIFFCAGEASVNGFPWGTENTILCALTVLLYRYITASAAYY